MRPRENERPFGDLDGDGVTDLVKNRTSDFKEIISMIERVRENTFRLVNRDLISMYNNVGRYVSGKLKAGNWGKSVVAEFADHIRRERPDIKGFSASNIWRMRQFYETYSHDEKLAALSREISWSNNLLIMARAKNRGSKEFYMMLAQKNNYSARELERQIDSGLYERTVISAEKNQSLIARNSGLSALRDSYVLEFLDLPERHEEKELRSSIIANLRSFILEFGKDFAFVGEEYRIEVGNTDFNIDLLFYNRELSCLIAVELKVGHFRPEHLGQLEFYLEALDRDVKKPGENPSVGLILCAGKDDAVVEYALSRSMSPALVAAYQLHLPNKALLEDRLRELTECAVSKEINDDDV